MPFESLRIIPGVDIEETQADNAAGISESNFIRWRDNLPEKRGGCTRFVNINYIGKSRALHAWQGLSTDKRFALGTTERLYVTSNGSATDITPQVITHTIPIVGGHPYVSSTSGSSIITVDDTLQTDLTVYDTVVFNTQIQVGGVLIYGAYDIVAVNVGGTYDIETGITANATSTTYYIPIFTTTDGSARIRCDIPNLNPMIPGAYYYAEGEVISFRVATEVAGVVIYGDYTVRDPDNTGFYFVAANAANQTTSQALNYGQGPNVTYYVTIGPQTLGQGYGIGFYKSYPETASVTGASSSGSYATLTLSGTSNFQPAVPSSKDFEYVTVSGVGAPYDGIHKLTSSTTSSVSFQLGAASILGAGGTVSTLTSSVTGASVTAGVATLTISGTNYFLPGDLILVAGVGVGYNGTQQITNITSTSVSFVLASGATLGAGGTIQNYHSSGGYGTGVVQQFADRGTKLSATDWTLDNWGEVLLACPRNGPIFNWAPSQGYGNAAMIAQAPIVNSGMFVAMPQRQIMAWGSTYTGIQDPLQIRWCDIGNYNDWTATITNQAGGYSIPTGSLIVRGIQGPTQQYWFTDIDVYVSQYTGPPYVYGFNKVGSGCGLIAQKAVCMLHSTMYWMSQKQFFVLSGTNAAQTIPCTVWDFVFQNLNLNYVDNIRAAPNSMFNEVNWFFPSTASTTGECDAYVCFNVLYNEWDYGYLSRSAWIDQSVLGGPLGTQNYYDAASATPWTSNVFQHETSYNLANLPMNAYFKTGYFTLSNGNDLVFVDWLLPDMKWGEYSQAPNASLEMTFYVTDYPGDTPVQYGPYTITANTPYIEPRFRGRYVQIEVASNDLNSFWRLGSMRYRYAVSGRR
jgi:hypothetical protein